MKEIVRNRYRILPIILACYFIPMWLLALVGGIKSSPEILWRLSGLGLLIAAVGSLLMFMLISSWENASQAVEEPGEELDSDTEAPEISLKQLEEVEMRYRNASENLAQALTKNELLEKDLFDGNSAFLELTKEHDRLKREIAQTQHEYEQFRESSEEKLEQNHIFLREYQQTINEQRSSVEAKQQLVEQLESKVRDLTYEIKTLLQLAEKCQTDKPPTVVPISHGQMLAESPVSYRTSSLGIPIDAHPHRPDDRLSVSTNAINQLRHCLNIAQKITGTSFHGQRTTRSSELSPDNNALEMRRLFDGLRSETTSALWVYSQAENKLLFANQAIKPLLGWNPDKFIQNFHDIIGDSLPQWQEGIGQLSYKCDCQVQMMMKSKNGQPISVQCHIGMVPTGLFKSHIIGIGYPAISTEH